jgi:uncharacterized membrane protein
MHASAAVTFDSLSPLQIYRTARENSMFHAMLSIILVVVVINLLLVAYMLIKGK